MEHAAVAIVRVSKYTGQMAYAVVSFGGLLGIVPSITRSPGGRSIMTKKWAAMSSISTGNSWRRLPPPKNRETGLVGSRVHRASTSIGMIVP
jgi:hypothetical protein